MEGPRTEEEERKKERKEKTKNKQTNKQTCKWRLRQDTYKEETYLLHLEFDSGLDFIHFVSQLFRMSTHGGELASFVEARAYQTRDLLDEGIRGDEGIILLGCRKTRKILESSKW